jgi:uncharacterized NAD(P)/FAD-binding protein YdhS
MAPGSLLKYHDRDIYIFMSLMPNYRSNRREHRVSCTIAIIGGGFTGTMLAVQLLRGACEAVSLVLIERGPLPGRGVAYGTQFEGHLLNVRARNMSAYPDIPDHFVRWAERNYSSSVKPDDFLPRTVYGQYISTQLREAVRLRPGHFRCIQDEAVALSLPEVDDVAEIRLASGATIVADKVAFALGNFPPADLALPGKTSSSARFVPNPWSAKTPADVHRDKAVLLIGSGLTSVDTAIGLRARGFEGTIHILSRRGLLPQSHRAAPPPPPFWSANSPRTARGLLRQMRQEVKAAEAQGLNWRQVVDSLRPVTQKIWQSLPPVEQRRFLRHLRTYWDVHRHRIAERIADQLTLQHRSGEIQIHAGRITGYREDAAGADIAYRERKTGKTAKLRVDRVFNCTGPDGDYRRVGSPLLRDLMEKKLARPDELLLGLDVSADGALVSPTGVPSNLLFAIGPLRKGKLWESVAVPELRVQVAELAKLFLAGFQPQNAEGAALGAETEASPSLHS